MSSNDYAIHLRPDELKYELEIRGVFNLSNSRARTVALRELLHKESTGQTMPPKRSSPAFNSSEEIEHCTKIHDNITDIAERAIKEKSTLGLTECSHRLHHLMMRLERISPMDDVEEENIRELLNCVYDAIHKLNDFVNNTATTTRGRQTISAKTQQQQPQIAGIENDSGATGFNSGGGDQQLNGAASLNLSNAISEALRSRRSENLRESLIDLNELNENDRSEIELEIERDLNPRFMRPSNANSALPSLLEKEFASLELPRRNVTSLPRSTPPVSRQRASNVDQTKLRSDHATLSNGPTVRNPFRDFDFPDRGVRFSEARWREIAQPKHYSNNGESQSYNFPRPNIITNANKRSVPVNQWRILFSGDGSNLHLYDFLLQISMYQRSEGVSNEEMMYSVVHLLTGRAKLWYLSIIDNMFSWDELVIAFKKEFLPANYDYLLFCELSNRTQKPHESFGEYITHMQSLFRCLSIPIAEEHKLFIVQKNLLPRFAMGVAPMELRSLNQLVEVCRRIENANVSTSGKYIQSLPFQNYVNRPRFYPNRNGYRDVNVIETENQMGTQPNWNTPEINLIRRTPTKPMDVERRPIRMQCWNCGSREHRFRECGFSRRGVFCFKCGRRDVVASNCQNCPGNMPGSSEQGGEISSSNTAPPQ